MVPLFLLLFLVILLLYCVSTNEYTIHSILSGGSRSGKNKSGKSSNNSRSDRSNKFTQRGSANKRGNDSASQNKYVPSPEIPITDDLIEKLLIGDPAGEDNAHGNTDLIIKMFRDDVKEILVQSDPLEVPVTIDDIPKMVEYIRHTQPKYSNSIHLGQRKLFVSELQFLSNYLDRIEKAIVVYAGAAPNHKGMYLAELFPNVIFILVDPDPFDILTKADQPIPVVLWNKTCERSIINKQGSKAIYKAYDDNLDDLTEEDKEKILTDVVMKRFKSPEWSKKDNRIFIINDFQSDALSLLINTTLGRVYFISDARTVVAGQGTPTTLDIVWNMAQQFNWCRTIDPVYAMFKFRHPHYDEPDFQKLLDDAKDDPLFKKDFDLAKDELNGIRGIDFVENAKNKKLIYFDGEIYIQAWRGQASTETRIVTDGKKIKEWFVDEFDGKNAWFNKVMRPFGFFKNEHTNVGNGFDHCYDCSLENKVWVDYFKKHRKMNDKEISDVIQDYVADLTRYTLSYDINQRTQHGFIYNRYDVINMDRRAKVDEVKNAKNAKKGSTKRSFQSKTGREYMG